MTGFRGLCGVNGASKKLRTLLPLLIGALFVSSASFAKVANPNESHTALFNNLPRVALLVKEQYVRPERINPDAMLASILESLELRITKLVVSLPKSLEVAIEKVRAAGVKPLDDANTIPSPSAAATTPAVPGVSKATPTTAKEVLTLDLGGTKKSFEFESQKSIWGMIFLLRDVFKFVEAEAKKQGLTEKSKAGEEPIDWEKIETGAINAMLSTLDPHSVFLEAKYARDLTLTTKGEFGGIGIVISVRDGFLTVISPIDGTPASVAGVKAKDRITKIDDDSAINMDLNDAVNLLRGKPASSVRITVQRANSPKEIEFTLKRAIIKVDSVAYALLDKNVGYLRIKAFQGNTAADVKQGILTLKKKANNKLNGLVFDLRGNPGGLLREAVDVSSLFIDGGEVVSTQGARPDSRQVEMASAGELDPTLKVVVLADGGSASASEIVAAAIKNGGPQSGRGIIVGERTFGKGSVQLLFDFPSIVEPKAEANVGAHVHDKPIEPAALKLTIAEYFGPNNTSMQNIGVIPDVSLAPVHASKKEELSLFPETATREVDLEGHLFTEKATPVAPDQPIVNIEFLAPKTDDDQQKAEEEASEYGKLNIATLKKDFAVTVASELILAAKSSSRKDLLENATSIRNRLQAEEQKKITEALKKFSIDWSEGSSKAKGAVAAVIAENKVVQAGNKLSVSIKVRNTSSEPLYQLHGITRSKTPLFDQKEFLFGKLMPGQEITRNAEFEIPKDVISRRDLMSLEIRDYRRDKISDIDVPLEIKGLDRPRFSHVVYVEDGFTGNGDGRVENGEDVTLAVWIKNVGNGKAFQPTILLRNESGSKVFLKNGRHQSGELLPNHETAAKFSFRVKEPTDKVDFELQIFDGEMHDVWRDKVTIDLSKKLATKTVSLSLLPTDKALTVFAEPNNKSKRIATLKDGARLHAIKEVGEFYLAKADAELIGFVKKAQVKTVSAARPDAKADAKEKKGVYTINYDRIPAQVSLKFADGSGLAKAESGRVVAEISDASNLTALLLYINGKKVLYKDISTSVGKQKFEHVVNLKPGVNVISLFAREDATFGQRENVTVYYDEDGKVSAALPKSHDKEARAR